MTEVVGQPVAEGAVPAKTFPKAGFVAIPIKGLADYNPEKQAADALLTETDTYVRRYMMPTKPLKEAKTGGAMNPRVDAVMQTPSFFREDGRTKWRWKPQRVAGDLSQFRQYVEQAQTKWSLESNGTPFETGDTGNFSGSTMATSLIDQNEFIPFLNGPFYKQLYQYDYLAMHAQAFHLTNYSALAAGAVKILTRFVIGRGISFLIKDPDCKTVWDEFWERNRMREAARQMARDITWQGELMMRYSEPVEGHVGFNVIDPSTCWEIVTDPENFNQVYYYHFQWPTPYQIWISGQIPVSKYIIQQVPPTQVQHVKINVSSQEKRGRSDFISVFPWLKRFNDFYNGVVVKAMLEANLVYKVKVHGDQNDVNTIASDPQFTILPPMGGMWLENDAVELSAVTASMTASRGSSGIGQQIAAIIATALNLPAEYFNIESGAAARATALVRTDPAVKTIEDRQQLIRELLEDTYDRVIEAAIRSGRISKEKARLEPETRSADHAMGGPVRAELAPGMPEPPMRHSAHAAPVRATIAGRNGGNTVRATLRG